MQNNCLLRAEDIYKEYKIDKNVLNVLNGISLSIAKGEIVVIIGDSGAGKSTLLHILGILDKPTSGSIYYDGHDLNKLSAKEQALKRNQLFGFVFQFYHLLSDFTALENAFMPALIGNQYRKTGIKKSEKLNKVTGLLEHVGLGGRLNHRPDQLSGGERQRVAIVRALINEPQILLCDEPTGNLDSSNSEEIQKLIWDFNERLGQTVVIVTHDSKLAKKAHRTIRVTDGKIAD